MKKTTVLAAAASLLMAGTVSAQTLDPNAGGEIKALLPDGVKASIGMERKPQKTKNIVVAGSPEKGYKAFFAAIDDAHGEELWVTDGESSRLVKDIIPGSGGSDVSYLTRFNDKVVFSADDGNGSQLWISDGTEDGTRMVKLIHDAGSAEPRGFTQLNETQMIFAAIDMDSEMTYEDPQWWLWVTDGTEDGTYKIKECDVKYPGALDESEAWAPFVRVGRRVFFKADNADKATDGGIGGELWVTDGTEVGTHLVKDINTEESALGTADPSLTHMFNFYNEKLFFRAFSLESGNEPWASDGTEAGTYEIYNTVDRKDAEGKGVGSNLTMAGYTPYNGYVLFRAKLDDIGNELGMTNCEKGNFKGVDINQTAPTNAKGSNNKNNFSWPDPGVEFDGVYLFCANSGENPEFPETNGSGELHYWDGNKVTRQSDFSGLAADWVKELTVASGSLYWWNEAAATAGSPNSIENQTKLFRIDNKEQFPQRVTNLFADGDQIHSIRNLGGDIIFTTNNEVKQIYRYHYRKADFDPATETDNLEPEYRTRAEMSGIDDVVKDAAETVVVYPNPAEARIQIKASGDIRRVKVYDLGGRLMMNRAAEEGTVDVSSLATGLYQVVVETSEGAASARLIKK